MKFFHRIFIIVDFKYELIIDKKFCNLTCERHFVYFWNFSDNSSDHSQTLPKYRGRHLWHKSGKKLAIFKAIWPKLPFEILILRKFQKCCRDIKFFNRVILIVNKVHVNGFRFKVLKGPSRTWFFSLLSFLKNYNNCDYKWFLLFLGKNKDPILMNMAPGMEHVSADKEFVKNSNRISTILSNNTRPGKKIKNLILFTKYYYLNNRKCSKHR